MYIVTNRHLKRSSGGLEIFDSKPNEKGANELRIVEVRKRGRSYSAERLPDRLSKADVKALAEKYSLAIDHRDPYYISLKVACEIFTQACSKKKHILLYVHGYNNDVRDIIRTADAIEQHYKDVLVVPFSWPAKGGGAISGTANYLNDKRDARASSGALDRTIEAVRVLHGLLVESQSQHLWERAIGRHPENPEQARIEFVRLQAATCKVRVSLMAHSMGCYVLKYATIPLASKIRTLVFDNVALVAADTNNAEHADWVGQIEARVGTYVVLNEEDFALQWSRRKPGEEQLARLGHYLKNLTARNVTYLDVTNAAHVGEQHGYFSGEAVEKNSRLARSFNDLFTGKRPEANSQWRYHPEFNAWRLR